MLVTLSAFLGTIHIRRDRIMTSSSPLEASAHAHELLRKLHAQSLEQEENFRIGDIPQESFDQFMQDKLVALEEDKCHLVYQLIRASGARNVVEVSQQADQCAYHALTDVRPAQALA